MTKKTLYVDMDNVLVNFQSGIDRLSAEVVAEYTDQLDNVPGIFSLMDPMEGAIEAYTLLAQKFDTYILSTAPWDNPTAWTDKLLWVKKYLGEVAYKRLILSHHKNLNRGDFLIDDRPNNGVEDFVGEWVRFGTEGLEDWEKVIEYMSLTTTD